MLDSDTIAELERAATSDDDQIILTRTSETGWQVEIRGNVPVMSIPILFRLQANLIEKGITG